MEKSLTCYDTIQGKIVKIIHFSCLSNAICTDSRERFVFTGHDNGQINQWNSVDYHLMKTFDVSAYRISCITSFDNSLWIGLVTGKIIVYENLVKVKEFMGGEGDVIAIEFDKESVGVCCLCERSMSMFDGFLLNDKCGRMMLNRRQEYTRTRKVKVNVVTWNCNAVRPFVLKNQSLFDGLFDDPDIIVLGFQELVDLENGTTAACIF